jgi:hypothetical protein
MSKFKTSIFIFILCSLLLIACKEEQKATPGQLVEAAKWREKQELRKRGKCSEENVLIELAGFELNIPREGAHLTLKDGTQLSDLKFIRDCKQKFKDVISVRWRDFSIADSDALPHTQYQSLKNVIEKGKDRIIKRDNGTLVLDSYIYVFPKELAPTGSDDPVAFKCSLTSIPASLCYASYVHPNGLALRYDFNRAKYDEKDYLAYDLSQREKLESMILKQP